MDRNTNWLRGALEQYRLRMSHETFEELLYRVVMSPRQALLEFEGWLENENLRVPESIQIYVNGTLKELADR